MKSTIQLLVLTSLLFGAGCTDSKKEAASASEPGKNTSLPITTSSSSSAPVVSGQPATVSQPVSAPQPVVTAGMNPAHGQPGHRCDIPVGAPLNSPPGNTAASASGATATPAARPNTLPPAPVLPVGPPVVTAQGMNPPHGQPGHDCSVAVGAPLPKP
ncbi:hypothetical protein [Rufibacter hautae]|uniref:Uncharacterized protein n=1 Tax=Rufibacter hautae TaxID=2595005 RepID=A0A5B6TK43_9BACT|nr:hypothetical protein [Rufibacter hautae]KAA3439820.1 hypothetical protein FOA19_03875 [Rufibacter hautae]